MKSTEIKEFGLVIIESLRAEDKKTGMILHEEIIKYKKFQEPNLCSILYQITTKIELDGAIDEVIEKTRNNCFYPILHFEAHGSNEGIQLASNEVITWKDLFIKIRELNILLKNSLVLHLGMCHGLSIIGSIDPTQRAPFMAIIGTSKKIGEFDLLKAFEEFYTDYLFSFSVLESVAKMNKILETEKPVFVLLTSAYCFDEIVNPDRDPVQFQKILRESAVREKATNPIYKHLSIELVQKYLNQTLRLQFEEVKQKRDFFTMKDLQK